MNRTGRSLLAVLCAVLLQASAAPAQGLPDLRLDTELLGSSVRYDLRLFDPNDPQSCELQPADLCVAGAGVRKLLRFSVLAINQGTADLTVGTPDPAVFLPDGTPMWVYSTCHKHYHFKTFAQYELRPRVAGEAVLVGEKRSFCIEDTTKIAPGAPEERRYGCNPNGLNTQGVQAGWGDLYSSNLPCQWIDVTDLATTGDFDLCVFVNPARLLPDADPSNDASCIPVTISGPPPGATPPSVTLVAPRKRKARAGKRLKVAWRKRVRGEFRFSEVHLSRDGGRSFEFVAALSTAKRNYYVWTLPADAVTDAAQVRVVVWAQAPGATPSDAGAILRGSRDSKPFRIVP